MKPRIRKYGGVWQINTEACYPCTLRDLNDAYKICQFLNRTERKLFLVA